VLFLPGLALAQLDLEPEPPSLIVLSPDGIAAPMSIDLDQLRNGSADKPDETNGQPNWQNGNVGDQQGHLEEHWSIPYRAKISNIPSACYDGTDSIRLVLGYDIKHSGAHAIDFLTSYNRLHLPGSTCEFPVGDHNIDPFFPDPTYGTPLFGGAINDWTHAYQIPCPECDDPYGDLPNGTQPENCCHSLPAVEREMRIWGGRIVNMYYADYPLGTGDGNKCVEGEEGNLSAAQSEARMVVVIDPGQEYVVLAWGGHIACRDAWGCEFNGVTVPCGTLGADPRSASDISGSPYHMRLIDWEGFSPSNCPEPNLGNTDRSLSAATVCTPPLVCDPTPDTVRVCEGADARLCVSVTGGLGPYTYTWSGPGCPCPAEACVTILGATPADAGTYVVTVTDQERTQTVCEVQLVVIPTPPCSITGDLLVCPSSTGNSYDGPLGNYAYQWSIVGNGTISGPTNERTVSVDAGATCGAPFTLRLRVTEPILGCIAVCSLTVMVNDTVDPTVVSCPVDATIDCNASIVFGTPSFDDNCDENLTVTFVQDTTPGDCPAEMTVTRTWTATDDCGNTAVCDQSITKQDNTPPSITCPPPVAVQCVGDVPDPDISLVSATDDCSEVTITWVGDGPLTDSCGGYITRTYRATDDCGNSADCTQWITVDDTNDPAVVSCPIDATIDCDATVAFGTPVFDDNCDNALDITFVDDTVPGRCAAEMTITRTWTATDYCGNAVQCEQSITLDDSTPPTITCPPDTSVQCVEDVPAPDISRVITSDDCSEVAVTWRGDTPLTDPCGGFITRTYRATDDCGNFTDCTQTITVDDTTPPTAICPPPVSVQCPDDVPAPDISLVVARDNCGNVTVSWVGDSPLTDPCGGTITRTYRATDDCGNFTDCTQTITVDDTTPPTATCPPPVSVQCPDDVPAPDISLVVARDNCGNVTVSWVGDSPLTDPCGGTITRTYRATDDCGNFTDCTQTITVDDATPPTATCPPPVSVQCPDDVPAPDISLVVARDNCGNVTVTWVGDSPLTDPCGGTITRTYRATDDCGNFTDCTQTITVDDTTPPACILPPDTSFFQCDPAEVCLPVSATDNCDPGVVCSLVDGPGVLDAGQWCYTPTGNETVAVTISCVDDCGNTCRGTFEVTFTVNEGPSCDFRPLSPAPPCPPFNYTFQMVTTDPEGDSVICTNTNDLVHFVDNVWSFTTTERGLTLYDTIICADVPCAEACTTFVFITTPNPQPPICTVPDDTTIYLCESMEVCLPVYAQFGSCRLAFGPGAYNDEDSLWCYTPEASETVTVGTECIGLCDTCRDSFTVTFVINTPPTIECQSDTLPVMVGDSVFATVVFHDDDDSVLAVTITEITLDGAPTVPFNTPSIDDEGHFAWLADEEPGIWCFTVAVADECDTVDCTFCVEVTQSREFCTLTQGAYGNPNGKFNGVVRTDLVYDLLATPLVIGKPGRSVTFEQADYMCIIERLPAGGTASALPDGLGDAMINQATCQTPVTLPVDKKGKFRNILLGQTITLALNLRLCCDALANLDLCPVFITQDALPGPDRLYGTEDDVLNPGLDGILGTFDDPTSTHYIPVSVLSALDSLGLPETVGGLLELANRALAGWNTAGASLASINYAVDAINTGFDECRFLIYCGDTLPIVTSTGGSLVKPVPAEYSLDQNYPNPFNASTVISYSLHKDGQVDLAVYNILGQRVATLVSEYQGPGAHHVTWTGTDEHGNMLASGIYFYRLQLGDRVETKKMLLLK
jgi:hypothetical protein